MRSLAERLSRAIVRLHPSAWRERYGEEMLALIEDSGSSWAHVFDLAAGCADEWFRVLPRSSQFEDNIAMPFLVLVLTETARWFTWTPPTNVQVALQWAFLILALNIIPLVFTILVFYVLFRLAWWLSGRRFPPVAQQSTRWTPSHRQLRAFKVLIMIFAVGTGLTPRLYPFPVAVIMMTIFAVKNLRTSLEIVHFLASGLRPWRAKWKGTV